MEEPASALLPYAAPWVQWNSEELLQLVLGISATECNDSVVDACCLTWQQVRAWGYLSADSGISETCELELAYERCIPLNS